MLKDIHNTTTHLGMGKKAVRHYFQKTRRAAPAVSVHFLAIFNLGVVEIPVKRAVVARSSVRTVNGGAGVDVLAALPAVAVIAAASVTVIFTQSPSFSPSASYI